MHPLNLLQRVNKEVFQFLHLHGYTFEYTIDNYYSDMTINLRIDFQDETYKDGFILDEKEYVFFKARINERFLNEPGRYERVMS